MVSNAQKRIIRALKNGSTLKSHRYLDGTKIYQLHHLDGTGTTMRQKTVAILRLRGFIQGNHKFPAATYVLTEKGKQLNID